LTNRVDHHPTRLKKSHLLEFFLSLFGAAHNDDAPPDDLVQPPDSDVNKATHKGKGILTGRAQ